MKKSNSIQKPGLRKNKFGSKAYLRAIRKRVKNNSIRTRKTSVKQ